MSESASKPAQGPPSAASANEGAVLCVVGARPNFMKVAPIMHAFRDVPGGPIPSYLVHTGQHYDRDMSESFFSALDIPKPDIDLGIGSGSHACQTADVMRSIEPVMDTCEPSAVLVVGDVNSTLAAALVAAKRNVPVIHVEAGLRSRDRSMPEEINRVLTDQISSILFTTEAKARDNLVREGVDARRIHFVGNVMIDTLLRHREKAVAADVTIAEKAPSIRQRASEDGYAALTLHRPANVDDPRVLRSLIEVIHEIGEKVPIAFAVHPRTKKALNEAGLFERLDGGNAVAFLPPLGYLEMLGLMAGARFVLTDSGGMQEETTALGVPCVTLRDNTERPITVEQGTNTVAGRDPARILAAVEGIVTTGGKRGRVPELWDGKAGQRIAAYLQKWLRGGRPDLGGV